MTENTYLQVKSEIKPTETQLSILVHYIEFIPSLQIEAVDLLLGMMELPHHLNLLALQKNKIRLFC